MKILYTLLILLVIYTICIVVRFKFVLSHAHLAEIKQEDQTLGQGSPLKYIAAGDSTAVGEGASSVQQSYAYKIAKHLSTSHTVQYKNVGVVGAKTNDAISDQLSKIVDYAPDVITLSVGANDVTHLRKPSIIVNNLKDMLKILVEKTNAQIYITNIPILEKASLLPLPYRLLLGYEAKRTNLQIQALENERIHIVNIHEFGWDNYPDIDSTFAKDKFHPSDEGYENWTNAFLSRIIEQYP